MFSTVAPVLLLYQSWPLHASLLTQTHQAAPLRPPFLLSLLRLALHRHARPAAGLEQATTGNLVGKGQGKCSSLAGKQQGKALNPNPGVAGDCPSSAKDLRLPRYLLPLGQQTQMGLQQGGSDC